MSAIESYQLELQTEPSVGENLLSELCYICEPNAGEYIWSFGESKADESDGLAFVFAMHGNELGPLIALKTILRDIAAMQHQLNKRILLIVGNPAAVTLRVRYVEIDENRIYGKKGHTIEHNRASVVQHIIQTAGINLLIDYHCTVNPSQPFAFVPKGHGNASSELTKKVLESHDVDTVLYADWQQYTDSPNEIDHWAVDISKGGISAVTIETGWMHDDPGPVDLTINGFRKCLQAAGVWDSDEQLLGKDGNPHEWAVTGAIHSGEGFHWAADIAVENFGEVKKGQIYGTRLKDELVADKDFALMFVKRNGEFNPMADQRVALILEKTC